MARIPASSAAVGSTDDAGAFPFLVRDRVRRSDVDAARHVNNAVYATYCEEARVAILGADGPYILARLELDFRARALCGQEIEVASRCSRVGNRSFDLDHRIFADGHLVAEARSVVVAYDRERQQSVAVSGAVRAMLRH